MKVTPLLFKQEMIQALIREIENPGTGKTMTRRVVDPQPPSECSIHYMLGGEAWLTRDKQSKFRHTWEAWGGDLYRNRPDGHLCGSHTVISRYGQPGDLIYAKETFYAWGRWETRFSEKKKRDEWHFIDMTFECGKEYLYFEPEGYDKLSRSGVYPTWWKRPSIFMPRRASRITLPLIDVRVERLQDISEEDAKAEGVEPICDNSPFGNLDGWKDYMIPDSMPFDNDKAKASFQSLWKSINGAESWNSNPYVWVLKFRPILANIDAVLQAPADYGIREAA